MRYINLTLLDLEEESIKIFNALGEDETLKQFGWADLNGDDNDRFLPF